MIFRDKSKGKGKSKRRKERRQENVVQKGKVTTMSGNFGDTNGSCSGE